MLNRLAQVMADRDATELIVPAPQPIKCACINNAGCTSAFPLLKTDSRATLLITECTPTKDATIITKGVIIKAHQPGIIPVCIVLKSSLKMIRTDRKMAN
jgi:hypothetical protein